MDIKELNKRTVKISDGSITVKDADGKTAGIVRGVRRFAALPANKQSDHFRTLRASGIWDAGEAAKVFSDGNELYFLYDLRKDETFRRYFEGREGFEEEKEKQARREKLRADAAQYMTVIPCFIA